MPADNRRQALPQQQLHAATRPVQEVSASHGSLCSCCCLACCFSWCFGCCFSWCFCCCLSCCFCCRFCCCFSCCLSWFFRCCFSWLWLLLSLAATAAISNSDPYQQKRSASACRFCRLGADALPAPGSMPRFGQCCRNLLYENRNAAAIFRSSRHKLPCIAAFAMVLPHHRSPPNACRPKMDPRI